MLQYFITMECLREQRRIHKAPDFLLFFCYPTYYPQNISSTSPYPHHPSQPLVFSPCWPWLILHPILLSSLPTQYTLATPSGFGLAHRNRLLSFSTLSFATWGPSPPAPLRQLDLGELQAHRVNDCFSFPVKFQGTSNFPRAQPASPQCFSTT